MRHPKALEEWPGGAGSCLSVLGALHCITAEKGVVCQKLACTKPLYFPNNQTEISAVSTRRSSTRIYRDGCKKVGNMWLAGLVEPFNWFILWANFLLVPLHFVALFNAQSVPGN
jgi:hypothetical protein